MSAKKTTTRNPSAAHPESLLATAKLAPLVHQIRNERVLLDSDLAKLYGVETRALNQAVKRNLDRFPDDFMFQLTDEETEATENSPTPSPSKAWPCFPASCAATEPSK